MPKVHIIDQQTSGVTNVGVTQCGNRWCHPIFSSPNTLLLLLLLELQILTI